MNYVLDTNILIYLFSGQLAEAIPDGNHGYSVITEIEVEIVSTAYSNGY